MKRLKPVIKLLVVLMVLVLSASVVSYGSQVSTESKNNEQGQDSPIESIIKKVKGYSEAGKFEEALKELNKALDKFPQKEYREKLQIECADVHFDWAMGLKKKYDYTNALKHLEIANNIDKNCRPKNSANDLNEIGLLYAKIGKNKRALEYYENALPIFQVLKDRAGEAMTLNNFGEVYYAIGQYNKALEFYEKALPIFQAVGDRSGEASILNNIGAVYDDLGQKQKALEYYKKTLPFWGEVGDRVGEAKTLNNIALVYSNLGRQQEALEYLEKALTILADNSDRAGEAMTLNNIGIVYFKTGQKHKALESFEKALPINQVVGDKLGEASTLNNIGFLYDTLGRKQKSLEYFKKALPIMKAVEYRAGEATTLNNIGFLYDALGLKQDALEYYGEALVIRKAIGDRAGEAATLNNIGIVYSDLGRKQDALEYYEKALSIIQAVGDRAGEAATLNGIGLVYSDLGQNQKALEFYEKALPISQAVGDRTGEAVTLNNIGIVYSDLNQKQEALEYLKKALSIRKEVDDRAGVAVTLNGIGLVYSDLDQKQKALEYFGKALPISQAVGDRSCEASILSNISKTHFKFGQKQKALEYLEKVLPIFQEVGSSAGEAITLNNLMFCWEGLKNTQFSIFYGKQSVNTFQNLRADISKLDRDIEKSYLEIAQNTYRFLAGLLIDEGRIPEAQHVLDMLKEKEYSEFTRRDQSPTTPTYSQIDFTEFEKQWLEKYKKATKDNFSISGDYYLLKKKKVKSDAEKKRLQQLEKSLEQFRKDYDEYLTELKKAFDNYEKITKKGIIKASNSQELLRIRQATLRKLDEEEGGKNVFLHFLVQEERIAVIFTTPDSQFVRFSNVNKKKLNRLILEYREAIERRNRAPQKGMNIDSVNKTIYGKLYDHIFKPVDEELKKYGATNLMIYLDGRLRYIALPVLWDGENYLVQRYRMALFTNASFERIQREPEENNKILGLGAGRGGEGFDPLPNVKEEIRSIVKDREKGFNGLIDGKAFLDNDFTKETFINQLKTAAYPLVHISSHFQFNKGNETKSHLLMGDGSLMNLLEIREQKGLFNGVELLMLSACETGRGDADGREIDGFGELAQQSGAQSVVASLWKVTDESTKDLMVNFYRILKEGKVTSKIEALHRAQLELAGLDDLLDKNNPTVKRERTKYSHPYYWGPFIMIGNWR